MNDWLTNNPESLMLNIYPDNPILSVHVTLNNPFCPAAIVVKLVALFDQYGEVVSPPLTVIFF